MRLGDLIKQQGIEPPNKEEQATSPTSASSAPRRRYFWDEEQPAPTSADPVADKVEPKLSETSAKVEPEPKPPLKPKLGQTSAKVEPRKRQRKIVEAKVEPQPEPIRESKLSQTSSKVEPNSSLEQLVGLQRNTLLHIFEMCVRTGNRITPPVAISNLAVSLETTVSAGRKAIQRLEEKGFIHRNAFKDGRGGWTKYELKEEVYKSLLLENRGSRLESNLSQSSAKVDTQLEPQLKPEVSCSSSSNLSSFLNSKETTTAEAVWLNIPEKLQGMIPVNQLRAMVKNGTIDQDTMEDSLWGFAHDLEKGLVKSKTGNVVGLFIGALKNGGYISQQYLAQKQKEASELRERIEEIKKIRGELESKRLFEEFEAFRRDFPAEAEALKPSNAYIKSFEQGGVGYKMWVEEFRLKTQKPGNA